MFAFSRFQNKKPRISEQSDACGVSIPSIWGIFSMMENNGLLTQRLQGDTLKAIYFHYILLYVNPICVISSGKGLKYTINSSTVY